MNTTNHTSPSGEDAANVAPCELCKGVGQIGMPGQRCFACDGSGKSKFAALAENGAIGEREAFEAWAKGRYLTRYIGTYMERTADAYERTRLAEAALSGWMARAALTAEKVAAEPAAYDMTYTNGNRSLVYPKELAHIEKARIVTGYVAAPLYATPQPAQTQVALTDIDQYRMQMAGICTAALGHWKEGDDLHPDYDTPALRDVAALYAKYEENRALLAAQPVSGGKS